MKHLILMASVLLGLASFTYTTSAASSPIDPVLQKHSAEYEKCNARAMNLDDQILCINTALNKLTVYGNSLFEAYRSTLYLGTNGVNAVAAHDKAQGLWLKYRADFCDLSGSVRGPTENLKKFRGLECLREVLKLRLRQLYP